MADYQKRLVDAFTSYVQEDFNHYHEEYGFDAKDKLDEFLTYLIDYNIIDTMTIKRYAILKDFDLLTMTGEHKKTAALKKLSRKYNVGERSLWALIGNKSNRRRFFRIDED